MGSPKAITALQSLGQDVRGARLRRRMAVADLAARAGTSASTLARLEKGDPGVSIGALADVLVVLGLIDRLADLIDIRKDDIGLALTADSLPRRGRSAVARHRVNADGQAVTLRRGIGIDPEGEAF